MFRTRALSRICLGPMLLFLTSSTAASQTLAWAARDGGILTDPYTELGAGPSQPTASQSMATDAYGNVYVTGTVQGVDLCILKFDSGGVRRWAATYDSGEREQAFGLALDGNGNVFVLGRQVVGSWFVAKFDGMNGVRQWVQALGPSFQRFNALAADSLGNVYVAGSASGFRVLKLDGNGVQQWAVTSGSGEAQVIGVDPGGNVYAAGSGFKAVKYTSVGVQQWVSVYGGTGAIGVFDLDLDSAGNIYLAGYRQSSGNPLSQDFLTVKLNGAGAQQWDAVYDGGSYDLAFALAVDGGGNVYVTGQSNTPTQGDFVTLKYNPSGALLWTAIDDTNGGYDIAYDLAVDGSGNATVTGRSQAGTSGSFHTIQYDPAGVTRWEATYNGPAEDYAQAVKLDLLGNVYVAGNFFDVNSDLRVIKYDASGAELWSVREGATDDAPDYFGSQSNFFHTRKTLAVDSVGSSYLAGSSFNGQNWDVRLVKFDAAGARQWASVLDTGGNDEPVALALDAGGNIYLAGFSGQYDIQIAKYDASGTLLWRTVHDGGAFDLPNDIAVDANGNLVVAGWTLQGANPYDFLTLKYDAAGTLLWSATYDGGRTDVSPEVEIDAVGNIIVSGVSQSPNLDSDTTTLKYDSAGNLQWAALDAHLNLTAMKLTADGSIYLLAIAAPDDVFVVKYDAAGARQWQSSYDGGSQDIALSAAVDAAGNVYAAGFTFNGTNYDVLTLSFDSSGAQRWVTTYDGGDYELGQFLTLDGAANVYVASYSWNGTNNDARLMKYDTAGTQQWTAAYDNGSHDYGYAVALDAGGGVYLAGDSVGSTTGPDLLLVKYVEQTRTVGFSAVASSLSEKANSASRPVVITTSDGLPSIGTVTVSYSCADGTAAAGQDYTSVSGSLSFPAGTPSGTVLNIAIPLLDDFMVEGAESFTIHLGAPAGASLATAVHTVTILDDDEAGFEARPRSGLRTDEDGGIDTFTVALTSQPAGDVFLGLSSNDLTEGLVSPGSLHFTPANWNLPQTVTVTGVDDVEVDGNVSYIVVLHPAMSADANYQGLDAADVTARNQDNDHGRHP